MVQPGCYPRNQTRNNITLCLQHIKLHLQHYAHQGVITEPIKPPGAPSVGMGTPRCHRRCQKMRLYVIHTSTHPSEHCCHIYRQEGAAALDHQVCWSRVTTISPQSNLTCVCSYIPGVTTETNPRTPL